MARVTIVDYLINVMNRYEAVDNIEGKAVYALGWEGFTTQRLGGGA